MQNIPISILKQRFWRKVELSPDGCWNWVGGHTKRGYGRFWDGTKKVLPNRFLYELTVGPIPDGFLLCHTCDNPPCVNPEHQFVGTHKDNQEDAMNKGRWHANTGKTYHHRAPELDPLLERIQTAHYEA